MLQILQFNNYSFKYLQTLLCINLVTEAFLHFGKGFCGSFVNINYKIFKKSCCIRIGPRCDVKCGSISTMKGHNLPWVSEMRYLGTYIINGRQFRCSVTNAKRSFNRSVNAIFAKLGG